MINNNNIHDNYSALLHYDRVCGCQKEMLLGSSRRIIRLLIKRGVEWARRILVIAVVYSYSHFVFDVEFNREV